MKIRVECYAGHKADERPVRFEPDAQFFKVCADHGNLYITRHRASVEVDDWSLESFRSLKR